MTILYNNGLCVNENFMYKSEAALVNNEQLGDIFRYCNMTQFDEFKYFTGISELKLYAFGNCNNLISIVIPSSVTDISRFIFTTNTSKPYLNVIFLSINPPNIERDSFGNKLKFYVPDSSISDYYLDEDWATHLKYKYPGSNIAELVYPHTYLSEISSLDISAEDVISYEVSTIITFTAKGLGKNILTEELTYDHTIIGMCNSTEFPKNLSIVDSVSRAITFTYLGKTATTTITQAALEPIYFEDPEAGIVLKAKGLIANASYSDEGELGLITSLNSTFYNNKILTKFPELRYCINVTNMTNTFSSCSSLTQAPIIPCKCYRYVWCIRSLLQLDRSPYHPCKCYQYEQYIPRLLQLNEAPTIPANVTNMSSTFYNCTKLTQAPIIPANVTSMS